MFHTVRLQPGDSARELSALGLKLKRKKRQNYILQPCPAFECSRCSIYAERPERCRVFECRQLQRLEAGKITEDIALEKIHEAQRQVARVNELLGLAGKTDMKRPLSKRFNKVMAEPVDATKDPAAAELRGRLTLAMLVLNAMLDQEFRPGHGGASAVSQEHVAEAVP